MRCFRDRCWVAPGLLLDLGLIEMTGRAKGTEYRCLVFADRVKGNQDVEHHLLRHYLDEAMVESLLPEEEEDGESS